MSDAFVRVRLPALVVVRVTAPEVPRRVVRPRDLQSVIVVLKGP